MSAPSTASNTGLRPESPPGGAPFGAEVRELLVESLLHEARNPLNALSINLEVLTERLRKESGGALAAAHAKNIDSIREQVRRVTSTLERFCEFLGPRGAPAGAVDAAGLVARALSVLGHEARRRRLTFRVEPIPPLSLRAEREGELPSRVLAPIAQVVLGAAGGEEIVVGVHADGSDAVLTVASEGGRGRTEAKLPLD